MAVETEGKHTGEFLVSEASGLRGRESGVLITGQNLEAGTILGQITIGSKFTRLDLAAVDGGEVAAGILYDNVDATSEDKKIVVVVADTVVRESSLIYSDSADAGEITATNAALKTLGIVLDNR